MAADSSTNETDAPPGGDEKPSPLREASGGPPRPPRPSKRASGPVRIPLPSALSSGPRLNGSARPQAPAVWPPAPTLAPLKEPSPAAEAEAAPVSVEADADVPSSAPNTPGREPPSSARGAPAVDAFDASGIPTPVPTARTSTRPPPAVTMPEVPGDPNANIEFPLTRLSSAAPPASFGSADGSDRAPALPLTPWRDEPASSESAEGDASPPRDDEDEDREETIVGDVSKDLLDLSSEDGEENTRAYQAPQELIDLAKRQREERRQAQTVSRKGDARAKFRDSLPPIARSLDDEDGDQSDISTATVPMPGPDAAPPVAVSGPARGAASAGPAFASNGAPSLSELAREISERRLPGSVPPPSVGRRESPPESAVSVSGYETPWLTRGRLWAVLVGVFIVVGYALARWRGLDLFP